jgi:hypothetical protein
LIWVICLLPHSLLLSNAAADNISDAGYISVYCPIFAPAWAINQIRNLRSFTTIFLLGIILLQTFDPLVIQVSYWVNKTYISTTLCENRDKPMLHCNGKCFLARQLKEQAKKEQRAPDAKKEQFEALPYCLPESLLIASASLTIERAYFHSDESLAVATHAAVFRPPIS